MYPVWLELGPLTVRGYGVMAALGFLCAVVILQGLRKKASLSGDQVTTLVLLGAVGGVVGARIFYVVQNWEYFSRHLGKIVRVDQGGLVFYGGFILATLVLIGYGKKAHLDIIRVLDLFAPALAVAHALGRIGCFFNGCCFGKPTNLPWAVVYPAGSAPDLFYHGLALHPVQLYEAGANLLLSGLFVLLVVKCKRGIAMSSYIFCYGLLRFMDEFLRGDHTDFVQGFTPAQVLGFALIPLGAALLIYFATRRRTALSENETMASGDGAA